MKRTALILSALLALTVLSAPAATGATLSMARAARADQRFEAHYYGISPARVHVRCQAGPNGGAGCDATICWPHRELSSSDGQFAITLDLGGAWMTHDGVIPGHGRPRVFMGEWATFAHPC